VFRGQKRPTNRVGAPTTDAEVAARAAGRRRYNSVRRSRAQLRRIEVLKLIGVYGGLHRGVQASIARTLGVSPATISRDLRGHLAPDRLEWCPLCGCGGHVLDGQLQPIDRDEDLDLKELFRLEDHVLDEP
jgi:hypothetical protein